MRSSLLCALALFPALAMTIDDTFQYPSSGFATMTHYDLPINFVASCGCTPASTHYPTAAMSQLAYGSTTSYGPGCGAFFPFRSVYPYAHCAFNHLGRCFNLTLLNTFLSDPPFFPETTNSIVVKITDLCPGTTWCGATPGKPNA